MNIDWSKIIEAILAAVFGGGGVFFWLTTRRKAKVESDVIAHQTAISSLLETTTFLKTRVTELGAENVILRTDNLTNQNLLTTQRKDMEAVRAENAALKLENTSLKAQLANLDGKLERLDEIVRLKLKVSELNMENVRLTDKQATMQSGTPKGE